jgi:hypothetical protein
MTPRFWRFYRGALRLLPRPFHDRYAEQMLQTAQDAAQERKGPAAAFAVRLFADFGKTWIREEARMIGIRASRKVLFTQAICLSLVAFGVALGAYGVMQQTLRRGANQPQIQMAAQAVERFRSVDHLNRACEPSCIDLAVSLEPFTIVYDESGRVLTSTAVLGGRVPVPPPGVLEFAKKQSSNVLTWQPRKGVRLATVIRHFTGEHYSGFVLAGRSLAVAEQGESLAFQCALWGWIAMVCVLLGSAAFFHRMQIVVDREPTVP